MAASKEPTEPHPLNGHFSKFEDAAEVALLDAYTCVTHGNLRISGI